MQGVDVTQTRLAFSGRILKGHGHFRDVMRELPYEALHDLLMNPQPVDISTFECIVNWCRPRIAKAFTFVEAVLISRLLKTRSEVFRKVKEGAMKWNGHRVCDTNMPIDFLDPGWAVIQLGKKTHGVLLDAGWEYADPNHPYNKETENE